MEQFSMLARAGYPNLRANAVDAMFHFADACARAARMNAGAGAGARAEDVIDARDATRRPPSSDSDAKNNDPDADPDADADADPPSFLDGIGEDAAGTFEGVIAHVVDAALQYAREDVGEEGAERLEHAYAAAAYATRGLPRMRCVLYTGPHTTPSAW